MPVSKESLLKVVNEFVREIPDEQSTMACEADVTMQQMS